MQISRRKLVAAAGAGALAAPLAVAASPADAETTSVSRQRSRRHHVVTGAQAAANSTWSMFDGQKVGVISNPTGILDDLEHVVDRMHADGVDVVAVFGPEHGFRGTAQAGSSEGATTDPRTGIPVYDAYGASDTKFAALFQQAGVETVVFDIQDVGARFYTYVWTMYQAMRGAALAGNIRFVVLDRPNPIGRAARGPMLDAAQQSGVGLRPILQQHGMTVGELATMFNAEYLPQDAGGVTIEQLDVVEVRGWHGELFADTGLTWVLPSPNMPTPDTALLYPGTCLFEASNMSEGRGTTRPFELIGAPYVDHQWAERLNAVGLAGVRFREAYFTPTISKNANAVCGGVQVHITEPAAVNAPATAVHMLCAARDLYPQFATRVLASDPYPWVWLDRLSGTTALRTQLVAGASASTIVSGWAQDERAWVKRRRRYLRY